MLMGRSELLVVVLVVLLLVTGAWFLKTGLWKRGRMVFVAVAVLAGFLLVTRRLGWGEFLVLVAIVALPALLLAPRRRPPDATGGPDRPR